MRRISVTKTKEQLIIENEELHSRLVETEEMLTAIRSGEVDAIMVSGTKGEQVYSISSAETPYRTFIEEMNEGAVTLTKDGIILYCNKRFAELVHEPIEHVIGSYLIHFVAPNDKSKLDSLLAQQTHNKNDTLIISLINTLYLKLSFHLLPPYLQGENCILIATDISDLKKKEKKLLELHSLLEQQLDKIKRLRMQLIDKKIDAEVEINKLKITNKKLVKEITKHKLVEAELKQKLKLKQKKATT
ncbi:MAG: PAS domain-containing protein [Bacteroidia bacterium]|nr:PAS domain-containing protein [Bacteroidia bacterium]